MSRDVALILLAGIVTLAGIVATVLLVRSGDVPAEAALGTVAGGIGVASFALGRLSGTKPE